MPVRVRSEIVDKKLLGEVVQLVEEKGDLPNLSVLFKRVSEKYNSYPNVKAISPSTVASRIAGWKISCKTQSGKNRTVDKELLRRALEQAEKDGALATQSILWQTVCEIYNKYKGIPSSLSPSVVRSRILEFEFELKTQSARGVIQASRSSRGSKIQKHPQFKLWFKEVRNEARKAGCLQRVENLINKVSMGSKTAAIKLHCLSCAGYSAIEVRECTVPSCPLFLVRPYQKGGYVPPERPEIPDEEFVAPEQPEKVDHSQVSAKLKRQAVTVNIDSLLEDEDDE